MAWPDCDTVRFYCSLHIWGLRKRQTVYQSTNNAASCCCDFSTDWIIIVWNRNCNPLTLPEKGSRGRSHSLLFPWRVNMEINQQWCTQPQHLSPPTPTVSFINMTCPLTHTPATSSPSTQICIYTSHYHSDCYILPIVQCHFHYWTSIQGLPNVSFWEVGGVGTDFVLREYAAILHRYIVS